jgi:hypothetical protein
MRTWDGASTFASFASHYENNMVTVSRNYDWEMGKDDCTYALGKLYKTCTKDRAKQLNGGDYTYRCVKYKSWAVNMGK